MNEPVRDQEEAGEDALRGSTMPGITLQLPVGMLATIGVLGVVLGVLAAILPARRAAKLDPLRALNYE